jgi:hypothetical protein
VDRMTLAYSMYTVADAEPARLAAAR